MNRRVVASCGTVLALVLAATAASAGDHVVGGKQLLLRAGAGGALTIQLRGADVPVPVPGSADDPSAVGLVVTLFGRASRTQASLLALPGSAWRVRSVPRATYRYANPAAGQGSPLVKSVMLRDGSGLQLRAKSAGLALDQPEGAVAVRVDMGGTRVSALFDPPAVRRDGARRFVARDADAATLPSCDDEVLQAIACEDGTSCGGTCPGDAACAGDPFGSCTCVSPHQPCGDTAPACNGECPVGEECANTGGTPYTGCGCLPVGSTPCGGVYPSCGDGDCPTGTSCVLDTFTCCGGVQISNCACSSGPPPLPCGGACPAGWTCVGPAPGFPEMCLPPFCSGGSGAPVCDGTCSQAGTECRSMGGLCFCLTPCIGGDPYPACGGACADPTWACTPTSDGCACIPPS